MILICYPGCTTCKKAQNWLAARGINYEYRGIKQNHPSYEELTAWHKQSGLPLKRFFNTSGTLYKELSLKDKIPLMGEEELYRLLATDGMLVKRPIVLNGNIVLVGFKEKEWETAFPIK